MKYKDFHWKFNVKCKIHDTISIMRLKRKKPPDKVLFCLRDEKLE